MTNAYLDILFNKTGNSFSNTELNNKFEKNAN